MTIIFKIRYKMLKINIIISCKFYSFINKLRGKHLVFYDAKLHTTHGSLQYYNVKTRHFGTLYVGATDEDKLKLAVENRIDQVVRFNPIYYKEYVNKKIDAKEIVFFD